MNNFSFRTCAQLWKQSLQSFDPSRLTHLSSFDGHWLFKILILFCGPFFLCSFFLFLSGSLYLHGLNSVAMAHVFSNTSKLVFSFLYLS